MSIIYVYPPNLLKPMTITGSGAVWRVVGANGSTYSTLSALYAAGTKPWPNMPAGSFVNWLMLHNLNSTTDGEGSAFRFWINASDSSEIGIGITVVTPGKIFIMDGKPVNNIWVYQHQSTDRLVILGGY